MIKNAKYFAWENIGYTLDLSGGERSRKWNMSKRFKFLIFFND